MVYSYLISKLTEIAKHIGDQKIEIACFQLGSLLEEIKQAYRSEQSKKDKDHY